MGGWCLLYEVFSNGMGGSCGAVDHIVGRDASSCVTYVVFVGGGGAFGNYWSYCGEEGLVIRSGGKD